MTKFSVTHLLGCLLFRFVVDTVLGVGRDKLLNLRKNEVGFILTVLDILAILNVHLKSEELD